MSEIDHLIKNLKLKKSQDYNFLRTEGLTYIERLGSKLWTDYNIHDPGITLLELLCYAITDLGYRTDFEIKDLLTKIIDGTDPDTGDFYTAAEILPAAPASFDDLRKMLIDITGVRNAWVSKNKEIQYCLDKNAAKLKDKCTKQNDEKLAPLNGLFDILIETDDDVRDQPRINYVGKKDNSGPGDYEDCGLKGINFKVLYPFELLSVSVIAKDAGNITVRLLKKDKSGVYQEISAISKNIDSADEKIEISNGFQLTKGDYRLDANGTIPWLFANDGHDYSKVYPNLLNLNGGFDGAVEDLKYYFFYDWKVSYKVMPTDKEKLDIGELYQAIAGLQEFDTGGPGAFILPNNKGLKFNVYGKTFLKSVKIFPENSGLVQLTILDFAGNQVFFDEFDVSANPDEGLNLLIETWLEPGSGYEIKAGGLVKLFRETGISSFQSMANPSLEIISGSPTTDYYFFFYNWEIIHYHPVPYTAYLTKKEVLIAAEDLIYKHRNLCEDLMHVRDLQSEFIGVCADIEVADDADIQQVLADIFFELEFYVSPPVIFYTIAELQKKGYSTDQIFEGPALQHGFIDNEEFMKIQRTCFLKTSDIIQIIMDIPGVIAVKDISLLSYIEVSAENPVKPGDNIVILSGTKFIVTEKDWILELANPAVLAPDFDPEKSKIVFYKDDLPYLPNKAKALDLFNEKRSMMYSRKLKGIQRDFPVPVGEFMDAEKYFPAQNDLPPTYMVGNNRVPESETELRKVQSKQLKAFLMFFEQILANYFSQLSHVRNLFDWKNEEIKTYFTQVVQDISGLEDIYIYDEEISDPDMAEQVFAKLNQIIETKKIAEDRKNRFLDHLIGRFAEDFTDYSLLMYAVYKKSAAQKIIGDKRDFLNDYQALSRDRGKGYDYRYPFLSENLTGLQRRISRLMGFDEVSRRNLAGDHLWIDRLEDAEGDGCPKNSWRFEYRNEENEVLFKSICCESRENICILLDSTIRIGACPDNYHFDEDEQKWKLLNNCENGEVIGTIETADDISLIEIQEYFKMLSQNEGFHVIEHILLRKRISEDSFMPVQLNAPGPDCENACIEVKDPYSFRATVFLPAWPKRFQSIRFRKMIERTLRLEAPAHVYLKICWLSHCDMLSFEKIYTQWAEDFARVGITYKGHPKISLNDFTPGSDAFDLLNSHREKLEKLINKLHNVDNVQPLAGLHDCENPDSENPQITLNQMSLGSN